jgi:pilus assembly protein CpaE
MRQVFESGADDLVNLAGSASPAAETFFALQKAVARRSRASAAGTQAETGSLICVLGPKGGTGKTLTSVNLGVALAEAGHRTVVVDLDLQFGDVGLVLGLQPERTIHDLATAGGSLDADKVETFLSVHPAGLRALLAPIRPDQATAVTPTFLAELYPILRAAYDFVIVDTPPGFTPEVIASIDASTAVCMVAMLDAPSLKNAKLGLETLELMGYAGERVRVLLNRADASLGVDRRDVAGILGRVPDVEVPSQRDVVRAINAGTPLVLSAHRSEPAKAYRGLAAAYVADRAPVAPAANGRRRFLRRK